MKSKLLTVLFTFIITSSQAQSAMQFSGLDCNGYSVDLNADLDAGKAVALIFYMPNCGTCPPVAQKIQQMANHINANIPGMVKGYAFPYTNSTTCSYSSNWVNSNNLSSLWTPMDSGALQVAYYGGFGMPTVVLLGGTDHRTMFSTLSFSTSDTTIMRDSILALLNTTAIEKLPESVSSFSVFPNPVKERINYSIELKEAGHLFIDLADVTGKQLAVLYNDIGNGNTTASYEIGGLPNGIYFLRARIKGETFTKIIRISR